MCRVRKRRGWRWKVGLRLPPDGLQVLGSDPPQGLAGGQGFFVRVGGRAARDGMRKEGVELGLWAVPPEPELICPVPPLNRLGDMSGGSCGPLELDGVQEQGWAPEKGPLLGESPLHVPTRPTGLLGSRIE